MNNTTDRFDLPPKLRDLSTLAFNYWWSWSADAEGLFESVDPPLWEAADRNPVVLLRDLSAARKNELIQDDPFLNHLERVAGAFSSYMRRPVERNVSL